MFHLPRLGVGSLGRPSANDVVVSQMAALAIQERCRFTGQSFAAGAMNELANPFSSSMVSLDPWAMSEDSCRQRFCYAADSCDVAVVSGQLSGDLKQIGSWLDLPMIGVLDLQSDLPSDACSLPTFSTPLDGVVLAGATDSRQVSCVSTTVESLWGTPVVGVLGDTPALRSQAAHAIQSGSVSNTLRKKISAAWRNAPEPARIKRIASRRFPWNAKDLFSPSRLEGLNIAVAYDEAFHRYLPHTFDVLEVCGAKVRDFSPISDELIPEGCDLVYLGGGNVSCFAEAISRNCCMRQAFALHLLRGGKVYAEGEAAGYICRDLLTAEGEQFSMLGLLPAFAVETGLSGFAPADLTLLNDGWLGDAAAKLQGYADQSIRILPAPEMKCGCKPTPAGCNWIEHGGAVASRVGLDLLTRATHLKRPAGPSMLSPVPALQ